MKNINFNSIIFLPFYLLSLLPFWVLYLLSDFVFLIIYYGVRYRRTVVRENLEQSFQHTKKEELIRIEKKFYHHFCDMIFEIFKTYTINQKSIKKRFYIKNASLIDHWVQQEGKNVLCYASHQGNWEWLVSVPLQFQPARISTFYQKLDSRYYDKLMKKLRSRFGVLCVELKDAYRVLLESTGQTQSSIVCMIGDQSPIKGVAHHSVHFLGRQTAFISGPPKIALKMSYRIVFPIQRKLSRGYYEVEFVEIMYESGDTEQDIIAKYAQLLEETIQRSPELWLWTHRRWKLTRTRKIGLVSKIGP